MRRPEIRDDAFVLPLSDDVEEESYTADMLVEDFAMLMERHGWSRDQIREAFAAYLEIGQ